MPFSILVNEEQDDRRLMLRQGKWRLPRQALPQWSLPWAQQCASRQLAVHHRRMAKDRVRRDTRQPEGGGVRGKQVVPQRRSRRPAWGPPRGGILQELRLRQTCLRQPDRAPSGARGPHWSSPTPGQEVSAISINPLRPPSRARVSSARIARTGSPASGCRRLRRPWRTTPCLRRLGHGRNSEAPRTGPEHP